MQISKTKKFIFWFCLGLYFLLGFINFSNSVTCFAMSQHQNTKIMSVRCHCPCCSPHMKVDSPSKLMQIANIDNCNCIKSNLPAGSLEQANLAITDNLGLNQIIEVHNTVLNLISFEDNKSNIVHYLDYRSYPNRNINKLRTVILLI